MQTTQQMSVPRVKLDIRDLVEHYYADVYRFCARRVGTELANDAAQDTFLSAQSALGKFRGESKPLTWLLGIAHNECRRIFRKNKLAPCQISLDTKGPAIEFEGIVIKRESLVQAFRQLSSEHREIVILHELEGLTYEEIAKVLNIPVGTVKSRLHHAFNNLRQTLGGTL